MPYKYGEHNRIKKPGPAPPTSEGGNSMVKLFEDQVKKSEAEVKNVEEKFNALMTTIQTTWIWKQPMVK